ncbi:hypothetical protein GGQ80_001595 [Sphingomonas jinjuensis]|uniref:Uncharacterized protein n=1 Tax=Sphingomonas jinjuensis TaxID=535907 RepID=A0A840F7J0_9SPHN|nr:TorF family putative porin [Sphingomonas jinjuensis]MBB4153689.1 hypothetical protein [Sphingomonas jinjuensis]
MKYYRLALTAVAAAAATPALAQETAPPKPITVSGSFAIVSDYRLRGVSQSDSKPALQGGITLTTDYGIYLGVWGSNLAGWGTFGGANLEFDYIGGYKAKLGNGTVDVGLTWYTYPGGADKTDFVEPFAKLSGTVGPASLTAGVAYAPKQEALGRWYNTGADAAAGIYNNPGAKYDNLYLWGDGAVGVPSTPFTAKGHIGYSRGNPGLGPNATSVAPTGKYWDWLVGVDYAVKDSPLTVGVAYTDTDISTRDAAYLQPSFSKGQDGSGSIAGPRIVFTATAAF